jgi:primosomal protein N' (replication factor Y)
MDRDSTAGKLSHASMVEDMEKGEIELLLGTQMVAKGHNFPSVTLAGIVSADVGLNLPDFRAGERAFQLFTQLAGRAGRGEIPGKVYIQTHCPDHYVFPYVKAYDYEGFFQKESAFRQELAYPPFGKLIRILFRTKGEDSKAMEDILKHELKDVLSKNIKGMEILGPCAAPIEKSKQYWRWHLLLKGSNSQILRDKAREILDALKQQKALKVDIDVDPVDML